MKVSLAFWNESKKKHGKGAPTLGLTPVLKEYDKAVKALEKTKSLENANKVRAELVKVETTAKKAQTTLDANYEKWKDLYGDVGTIIERAKKDRTELEEIENELGLQAKVDKAANELEAGYEVSWDSFEKVRDGLGKYQDKENYQMALDLLTKLKGQANKIIDTASGSGLALLGKYQKQLKVLTSLETSMTQKLRAYESALDVMVQEREELLKEFEKVNGMLTQTTSQLENLKGKAQQAKNDNNAAELLKHKKTAAVVSQGGLSKYTELADGSYKPGTKLRGALDVKAAKVSQTDSDTVIRPLSDKSFTAFKALTDLKRGIEGLAKEILTIQ